MFNEGNLLEVYQIAFDLAEVGSQAFIREVRSDLSDAGLGAGEDSVSYGFKTLRNIC
jgi:hypothetical protein